MRVTIIADDKCVGIDGTSYSSLDFGALDPGIHAIQWYGEHGEVEYKQKIENGVSVKPNNVIISSLGSYTNFILLWEAAHEAAIRVAPPTLAEGEIPVSDLTNDAL